MGICAVTSDYKNHYPGKPKEIENPRSAGPRLSASMLRTFGPPTPSTKELKLLYAPGSLL